ncbi:helix-turn-helix transcriptional regulator [Fontibacillus sp. BL9]|uniref:helix-turn-helix transcriptional regulator n=1 Tax=Fontibacillus sp. BL9 TaxID=3389971 RepID=UPI0039797038
MERLLAMTVLLLNRGRMSAKELAERFEVSVKTIYRDMETLNRAGIPVTAVQGNSGGFEIMDRYKLDRHLVSPGEVSSLLAALQGVTHAMEDRTYSDLQEKFKTLLQPADKSVLESGGGSLVFDFQPWGQGPAIKQKVTLLRQAVQDKQLAKLSYINQDGTESIRIVEPSALVMKGSAWYLQGYCRLRGDFRMFRLSRVTELSLLPESFTPRDAPALDGYSWDPAWSRKEECEIRLIFRPEARYRMGEMFSPEQIIPLQGGDFAVQGSFSLDEWFYSLILGFGDLVKVEYPDSLAKEIKARAERIVSLYGSGC